MRFEHVLKIYWTKGFFFGGNLFNFDTSIDEIIRECTGLGKTTHHLWTRRFEMTHWNKFNRYKNLKFFLKRYFYRVHIPINVMLSQFNSINTRLYELHRFNVVRYYLIRSYRGKCHALGKPANGQRTWSNAWSAFNTNRVLRAFITETKKQMQKDFKPEKINYRLTKKKYGQQKKKNPLATVIVNTSKWF